jgi:hypothetical protein
MVEVASYGGAVEEVDVDSSDDLRDRFGSRIPVLLADDGSVIDEGRIKRRSLRKGLRTWRRSRG